MGLALLGSVVTSSYATAADFKRIKTAGEFSKLVVGKKLWHDKNHVQVSKEGSWGGDFGGKTLGGAWEWKNGYWCRTLEQDGDSVDCQMWTYSGKTFKITRAKGKGKSFEYVLK